MITAIVDFEKCGPCTRCEIVKACDIRAIIKVDDDEPAIIDQALCHGCAECLPHCPYGAISIIEI